MLFYSVMSTYLLEVTVYRGNSPAKGVRVRAKEASPIGDFTSEERTGSDGRALISTEHNRKYILYVDGRNQGEHRSPGRAVVYL